MEEEWTLLDLLGAPSRFPHHALEVEPPKISPMALLTGVEEECLPCPSQSQELQTQCDTCTHGWQELIHPPGLLLLPLGLYLCSCICQGVFP